VNALTRVRRATKRRAEAEREWRNAVRSAHAEGVSLRAIAAAAAVSHVRVLQITQEASG
jgi:hypothetical protein